MRNYKVFFNNLKELEPSTELYRSILEKIELDVQSKARLKVFYSGILSIFSFSAVIFSFYYLVSGISQSGFGQYFSLIFSDSGAVIYFWRELMLSLIEALPVTGLILTLLSLFLLTSSIKFIAKNISKAFLSVKLS